ncbi:MAG: aldo/keto reductase [Bacteroidota bacterium]
MNSKIIQETEVPELGLSTFKLFGKECTLVIQKAIELGFRHFDLAQDHKNERDVGEAIRKTRLPREQLFITTKLWHTNLEEDRVIASTEHALSEMELDYMDLLLIHWPNPEVELRETVEAMLSLRDQGKVLHIGASNFTMDLMSEFNEEIGAPVFCNQIEYHPFIGPFDMLDYASVHDIMLGAYLPTAGGKIAHNDLIQHIAKKYGKSPAQIALRWLIEQEQVIAIPTFSDLQELEEYVQIYDFQLEDEDFYAIDDLEKSIRINNPEFAPDWDH